MSFTSPTLSGYNTNAPSDDGSVTPANKGSWATIKTKLSDPLKTWIDALITNTASAFVATNYNTVTLSGPGTLTSAHNGKMVLIDDDLTLSAVASLGTTFATTIRNTSDADITITPDGSETIEGLVEFVLGARDSIDLMYASTTNTVVITHNAIPVGGYIEYAGSTLPSNFLACDGSEISRTTYAALFGKISTTYGIGDNSTTFNLPDRRGAVSVGAGTGTRVLTLLTATASNDQLTVASTTGWQTGMAVVYAQGTAISGLSNGTYYLVIVNSTTIKLATSVANAIKATPTIVDITADWSAGDGTLTHTYTARSVGNVGGEETHALTIAELPQFYGLLSLDGNQGGGGSGAHNYLSIGSNTPHNNMPPYIVCNIAIRAF